MRNALSFSVATLAVIAIAAVLPHSAEAQKKEIKFRVPVKLQELHQNVHSVFVSCQLQPDGPRGSNVRGVDRSVRKFDEVLDVRVQYDFIRAHLYRGWKCDLKLKDFRVPPSSETPSFSAELNSTRAKPGTKLVTTVEGVFDPRLREPTGELAPAAPQAVPSRPSAAPKVIRRAPAAAPRR